MDSRFKMAGMSESEMSKRVQFVINSSSGTRTRLYKTNDAGLLEPVNDLDIVESLLIQAVHNVFKDKNVVLLKSCLKPSLNSPGKAEKKVRLLLLPDSRENLDENSYNEQQDSSKKVRFLLRTDPMENLDEQLYRPDDKVTDSLDLDTLDDLDTLPELDISWDEVSFDQQETRQVVTESGDINKQEETKQGKPIETLVGEIKLGTDNQKRPAEDVEDSDTCPRENWGYSDDDFKSIDTDTERESLNEDSYSDDSSVDNSAGISTITLIQEMSWSYLHFVSYRWYRFTHFIYFHRNKSKTKPVKYV